MGWVGVGVESEEKTSPRCRGQADQGGAEKQGRTGPDGGRGGGK